MKQRELEWALDSLEWQFASPSASLEQHATPPDVAAALLHAACLRGDVVERFVCDLGCGPGVLAIGAAALGAAAVIGLEVDEEALQQARENAEGAEVDDVCEWVMADLTCAPIHRLLALGREGADDDSGGEGQEEAEAASEAGMERGLEVDGGDGTTGGVPGGTGALISWKWRKCVDTVVMNPPFGTKRKGIDMAFLEAAVCLARRSVYSLHKSSTRAYIQGRVDRMGCKGRPIAQCRYPLPKTQKHHKHASVDVEVDVWVVEPPREDDKDGCEINLPM